MPFVVATAVVVVAAVVVVVAAVVVVATVVVVVAAVVVVATAVVVVFHFNKRTWIFFNLFSKKCKKLFSEEEEEKNHVFFQKPVLTGFSRKEFLCKSSKIFLWPILSQSMNGHKFES